MPLGCTPYTSFVPLPASRSIRDLALALAPPPSELPLDLLGPVAASFSVVSAVHHTRAHHLRSGSPSTVLRTQQVLAEDAQQLVLRLSQRAPKDSSVGAHVRLPRLRMPSVAPMSMPSFSASARWVTCGEKGDKPNRPPRLSAGSADASVDVIFHAGCDLQIVFFRRNFVQEGLVRASGR